MSNRHEIEALAREMVACLPKAISTTYDVRLLHITANLEIVKALRQLTEVAYQILEAVETRNEADGNMEVNS